MLLFLAKFGGRNARVLGALYPPPPPLVVPTALHTMPKSESAELASDDDVSTSSQKLPADPIIS